ncbi:hypothetical protein L218DRAFT_112174 [Marasmius fiardii PR-910]|nr:hypothetical protein L218DRAFT_112174 [Marasmius fiardii PR-910]
MNTYHMRINGNKVAALTDCWRNHTYSEDQQRIFDDDWAPFTNILRSLCVIYRHRCW